MANVKDLSEVQKTTPSSEGRSGGARENFLRKASDYFPIMRMVSYQFEATYDYLYRRLADVHLLQAVAEKFTEACQKFIGDAGVVKEGQYFHHHLARNAKYKILGLLPFSRDVDGVRNKPFMGQNFPENKKPSDPLVRNILFARNLLNVFEAVVFICVSTFSRNFERKDLVEDFAGLIEKESNKSRDEVGYNDLKQSKNPFVESEIKKINQKYGMRYFTDMAFAFGLKTGIILKTSMYPLEYGAFRQKTPLGELRSVLHDMHENNMGAAGFGKDNLASSMAKLLQQTLAKHKYTKLNEGELQQVMENVIVPLAELMQARKADIGDFAWVFSDLSSNSKQVIERAEQKFAFLEEKPAISVQTEPANLAPAKTRETKPHADIVRASQLNLNAAQAR
jgi:hypothetical protein